MTLLLLLTVPLSGLGAQTPDKHGVVIRHVYNSDDSYTFLADNPYFIPYTIYLSFPVLDNLYADRRVPITLILPPGTKDLELVHLDPGEGTQTRMSYEYTAVMGDITRTPDSGFKYLFPYEHGTKHMVGQGFNGVFSHSGQNQYAVDFNMDVGTPVYAARAGMVAECKEDSNQGGPGPEFNSYGNQILIWHDDGTFGNYVHLRYQGVEVEPGQRVEAGQLIGYSGNTGRSTGPHLHFDVRVPSTKGMLTSIPIVFLGHDGEATVPQANEFYYSTHPGLPDFPMLLGKNLKDEDFETWLRTVEADGKVNIRAEQIDNTVVLFVSSGFSQDSEIELTLTLQNMSSSQGKKITINVPAKSEVFLTILNMVDPSRRSNYQISYRYWQ